MSFFYFKALHIIFVVSWFCGLFYLVRLFIYHTEAQEKDSETRRILGEQFSIMERRLWYGITWPACILSLLFGMAMIHDYLPLADNPWLTVKLLFVVLLFFYHLSLGNIYKKIKNNIFKYNSTQLRVWNEVATVLLVAIVFLVVLKDILHMGKALIGLFIFIGVLMFAIRAYKKLRKDS